MAKKEYVEKHLLLHKILRVNSQVEQGIKYYNSIFNLILNTPTADVAEVCRCEKCKYFMKYNEDDVGKVEKADGTCYIRKMYSCDPQFCAVKSDDFCSHGTPKEEAGCK